MVTIRSDTSLEYCEFCPHCMCNRQEIDAMTGPEVMRAFTGWARQPTNSTHPCLGDSCYPLYIGHPLNGRWYVRERAPGTGVWRAEEDGSFTLLEHTRPWMASNEETLEAAIKAFCAAEGAAAIEAAMAEVLRIGEALGYEESYIRALVNDSLEAQALKDP